MHHITVGGPNYYCTFLYRIGYCRAVFIVVSLPVTKDWAATKALGSLNKDFGIEISKKCKS